MPRVWSFGYSRCGDCLCQAPRPLTMLRVQRSQIFLHPANAECDSVGIRRRSEVEHSIDHLVDRQIRRIKPDRIVGRAQR